MSLRRPKFRSDLQARRVRRGGAVHVEVACPVTGSRTRFSPIGYAIARRMDGRRDLDELAERLAEELGIAVPVAKLERLATRLDEIGCLKRAPLESQTASIAPEQLAAVLCLAGPAVTRVYPRSTPAGDAPAGDAPRDDIDDMVTRLFPSQEATRLLPRPRARLPRVAPPPVPRAAAPRPPAPRRRPSPSPSRRPSAGPAPSRSPSASSQPPIARAAPRRRPSASSQPPIARAAPRRRPIASSQPPSARSAPRRRPIARAAPRRRAGGGTTALTTPLPATSERDPAGAPLDARVWLALAFLAVAATWASWSLLRLL